MDLDGGLIFRVTQGVDEFDRAVRQGVREEVLAGSGRIAWKFIEEYRAKHDAVPGRKLVEEVCGCSFKEVDAKLGWITGQILRRDLFNVLKEGMVGAEKALENVDPEEALKRIEKLAADARLRRVDRASVERLMDLGPEVINMYRRTKDGAIGVPLPWPSMNEMTMGLWPGTLTFFAARPGTGKCVCAETEIPSPVDGVYRPIEQVVRRRMKVLTRTDGREIVGVTPSAHLDTGTKRCLKVVTCSGLELVETPEHPLSTMDGWKRTDELEIGEFVETMKWMPEPEDADDSVPQEHVVLLAAMLAEGGYTGRQITFTNEDQAIVGEVRMAVENLGGKMVQYPGMKSFEYALTGDGGSSREKQPIRFFLDMWGIGNDKAIQKTIPDRVFGLSNRLLGKFLGMFWSCDGTVEEGTIPLAVTLGSEKMVRQIKRLLLRFGITSRVAYKPVRLDGKMFDSWRLTVHSTCIDLFRESVELVGEKVRKFPSGEFGKSPNVDTIPVTGTLKAMIREAYERGKSKGVRCSEVAALLGRKSFEVSKLVRRRSVSRRMLVAFAEVYGADDLKAVCRSHWDEIVAIEDAGERRVFDLTVPETHCFVANDVVAHNTFTVVLISLYAWREGYRVLLVSPEMSSIEIAERAFAIQTRTNYRDVVSGSLGEFAEKRFFEGVMTLKGMEGLYILSNEDDMRPDAIEDAIDEVAPDVVGIDSAYMLKTAPGNRYERIIATVDWLRGMARRKNVPIIALSQLRKLDSKKKGGGMDDVAMSDTISWDTHNLFALHQDDDMKADKIMEFRPLKVRRQAFQRDVTVNWDFDVMNFEEIGAEGEGFTDAGFSDDDVPF